MMPSSYATEWADAVDRSTRFGLDVPRHVVEPATRYLTAERIAEFAGVVARSIPGLRVDDLKLKCLDIHYRLLPAVEAWLGCPVLYTLGWVDDGTAQGMFKFDDTFIAEKMKDGNERTIINMHAWITLPSMEVIDVSLPTSFAILQNLPQGRGAVLAGHADEFKGFAYKPMLVGAEFLHRAGLLVAWGSAAHRAKLISSI